MPAISLRTKLGWIAIFLLVASGALYFVPAAQDSSGGLGLFSACLRVGTVTAVFWLAYPSLVGLPSWLLPALVLVALAMARWPRLLFFVPVVIAAGWLLKPRDPARVRRR